MAEDRGRPDLTGPPAGTGGPHVLWSVYKIPHNTLIVKAVYHNKPRFVGFDEIGLRLLYTFPKAVVFLNRIKELRARDGLKQADLAKMLNITANAVSNYEVGARDIDSETILRLCEIFGCTADYLLGRSPLPSPDLDPEEESLLLAYRAATPEIRAIVDHALLPYQGDVGASSTA